MGRVDVGFEDGVLCRGLRPNDEVFCDIGVGGVAVYGRGVWR